MYVLVYTPFPFTGFESLPESVQTNLSKSIRNRQVICLATWSLSSLEVTNLFMMGPTVLRWVPNHQSLG